MHATIIRKGRAVVARGPGAHYQSLMGRRMGPSLLSISPPSLGPWFLQGLPHSLCQWCGAFWNVWGPGEAVSAHGGWGGEEGVHTDMSDEGMGEALVGGGRG